MFNENLSRALNSLGIDEDAFFNALLDDYSVKIAKEYDHINAVEILKDVFGFFGIKPEEIPQEYVQKICEILVKSGRISELESFVEFTNAKPSLSKDDILDVFRWVYLSPKKINTLERFVETELVIPEETLQRKYERWLSSGQFSKIEEWVKFKKVYPSKEMVDNAYTTILLEGIDEESIKKCERIKELTNFKPSKKVVQQASENLFQQEYSVREKVEKLEWLVKFSEALPSEEILQEICEKAIWNEDEYSLEKILEIWGSKPSLSPEFVKKVCIKTENPRNLVSLLKMVKFDLKEEFLQEIFISVLEEKKEKGVKILMEWVSSTNIKPKIPNVTIQEGYEYCLSQEEKSAAELLKELTKTDPDVKVVKKVVSKKLQYLSPPSKEFLTWLSKFAHYDLTEDVQEAYEKNIESPGNMEALFDYFFPDIKPTRDTTLKIYSVIAENENYKSYNSWPILEKIIETGTIPPSDVAQKLYVKFADSIEIVKKLKEAFKIDILKETAKEMYRERPMWEWDKLVELTNVLPDEEDQYAHIKFIRSNPLESIIIYERIKLGASEEVYKTLIKEMYKDLYSIDIEKFNKEKALLCKN